MFLPQSHHLNQILHVVGKEILHDKLADGNVICKVVDTLLGEKPSAHNEHAAILKC